MSPLYVVEDSGKWYVRFHYHGFGERVPRQAGGPFDSQEEADAYRKACDLVGRIL